MSRHPRLQRATLHFFCGKAGAGKSTIARELAAAEGAILLCEDVWLARLHGEEMKTFEDYRRFSQRLRTVVGPLATDLLRGGCSVVLDFPGNTRAARAWFRALAEEAGASHVLHFVDSADATCLARIAERNVQRPEGSHHLTPEQFAAISAFFEPPEAGEGLVLRRHAPQVG
jgi:predicted kinase